MGVSSVREGQSHSLVPIIMVTPVKKVPIHLQSAQNRLIIKNGTVVNCDKEEQVDIYIEDGVVRLMGNHLIIPGGTRAIDATGKFIMPGGIDMNVHLQRPGFGTQTIDDFYQGTKAALAGGTTMVVDMVVPDKEETLMEAFEKWRKWADDKVCCDYALKMAIPKHNPGVEDEMGTMTTAEVGVNVFSVFMSGDKSLSDSQLIDTFHTVSKLGGVVSVHQAENEEVVMEGERKMLAAGVTGPEGHAQVRLLLDDEYSVDGLKLVSGTHGMDVPNACSIVIIAGKYLDKVDRVMSQVDRITEDIDHMPVAAFIFRDQESDEVHFSADIRDRMSPAMIHTCWPTSDLKAVYTICLGRRIANSRNATFLFGLYTSWNW